METKNHFDSFTKKLTLDTNDPDQRTVLITCQGKLMVPVRTEPKRLLFGKVLEYGQPQTKSAKITAGDGGPIKPVLIPFDTPGLEVRIVPEVEGQVYVLEATVTPSLLTESLRNSIRFLTGIEAAPVDQIPVFGKLITRLQASPYGLAFPLVRSEEASRYVRLVWSENKPAQITAVNTNVPGAEATWRESNGIQFVSISVPPVNFDPSISYVLNIMTDDPRAPQLQVPVAFKPVREDQLRILDTAPTIRTKGSK